MARNGSGSYSLPAGNPVVSGTTISSTWANATLSDLANEMTDSLSRSGKGGMSGQFLSADGTVAAPAVSFTADTDTGFYRIGANNLGLSIGGSKVLDIGAATTALTGALTVSTTLDVTGAATLSSTAHIVGAITADSTIGSKKVTATGAAGVEGVEAANGTAATAATPQNALVLSNGYLSMSGVTDPNSDVAINKLLVPALIPRAWAVVNVDVGGNATIVDGVNVASVAISGGGTIVVTLAQAMADTNYAPVSSAVGVVSFTTQVQANSTTEVYVRGYETSGAGASITWTDGTARKITLAVFGRQ